MSTDFSLEALLNGSCSSSSVSLSSSDRPTSSRAATTRGQLVSQIIPPTSTAECETAATADLMTSTRSKRKREDDDDRKENVQPGGAEPKKKKRVRVAFTSEQLQRLQSAFAQDKYPDKLMRQKIAEELGLPDQKVHVSDKKCTRY